MIYTEKIKIKPNKILEQRLILLCNNSRFIYNFLLSESKKYKKELKETVPMKEITNYRKKYRLLVNESRMYDKYGEIYNDEFQKILKETPSQIVDKECEFLKKAWDDTVDFIKKNEKAKKPKPLDKIHTSPVFKKINKDKMSFTIHRKNETNFKINDNILKVSKMEFKIDKCRFINLIDPSKDIKLITVSKSNYGWYLSICIDIPDNVFGRDLTHKECGIDWGVSKFATDSDGNYYSFKEQENYTKYIRMEKRIRKLNKKLSNKRNKNNNCYRSNRYKKLKIKISKLYETMANIRRNFIHHVSKYYIMNYDVIVIEDIKTSNMMKNHKLARSIAESMFYTWKAILSYKSLWHGNNLSLVPPRNTSQTCSSCGYVKTGDDKLQLKEKIYKCNNCGLEIDRDYNASINILNKSK